MQSQLLAKARQDAQLAIEETEAPNQSAKIIDPVQAQTPSRPHSVDGVAETPAKIKLRALAPTTSESEKQVQPTISVGESPISVGDPKADRSIALAAPRDCNVECSIKITGLKDKGQIQLTWN